MCACPRQRRLQLSGLRLVAGFVGLVSLGSCTIDRVTATRLVDERAVDAGAVAADDGGVDEASLERRWGQFSQRLAIGACTTGEALVVDTVDDTLEGGPVLTDRSKAGPTLSLREALFLAAYTVGPHRIHFDARVFPPGEAAIIHITDGSLPMPPPVMSTCIDARGRGVIIEVVTNSFSAKCPQGVCMWSLGPGSQMTGLVIKGYGDPIDISFALVAGNRFSVSNTALNASDGAIIGPWNVFGHGQNAIILDAYQQNPPVMARIDGNFFGVEPTTLVDLTLKTAFGAAGGLEFVNNVARAEITALGSAGTISNNRFLNRGSPVFVLGTGWQIGPGNTFVGSIVSGSNHIFGNTVEGSIFSSGLVAPLSDARVGSVTGACVADGTVEVSIEIHSLSFPVWAPVGSTSCKANETWSVESSQLRVGIRAASLFTSADGGTTGPYSTPMTIR